MSSLSATIDSVQPKLVKIHGAGGLQRLEAYQTGTLISAEGHTLTAWSYVLDTADVAVTLADGRRKLASHSDLLERICILEEHSEQKIVVVNPDVHT